MELRRCAGFYRCLAVAFTGVVTGAQVAEHKKTSNWWPRFATFIVKAIGPMAALE